MDDKNPMRSPITPPPIDINKESLWTLFFNSQFAINSIVFKFFDCLPGSRW